MIYVLYGALGGLIRVLLGWQSNMQKEGMVVPFDWAKAAVTVVLGAVGGAVAEPLGALVGLPTPLPTGLVIVIGASAAYFLEDALAKIRKEVLNSRT